MALSKLSVPFPSLRTYLPSGPAGPNGWSHFVEEGVVESPTTPPLRSPQNIVPPNLNLETLNCSFQVDTLTPAYTPGTSNQPYFVFCGGLDQVSTTSPEEILSPPPETITSLFSAFELPCEAYSNQGSSSCGGSSSSPEIKQESNNKVCA